MRALRALIVDTYYPAFLTAHYESRPGLAKRSYEEQLGALMGRCFGTTDAYSRYLKALGHEARDVVVNCEELQLRWAAEHGTGRLLRLARSAAPGRIGLAARHLLLHRIAAEQIRDYDPDVVYVQDLWFFSRRELDALRRSGRLIVGQIASEPPAPEILRGFDLITTSFPHYVERFRAQGVDSEYLRIAFYEPVLDRLGIGAERPHAVSFVGGLNPSVHGRGTDLLERVAASVDLE